MNTPPNSIVPWHLWRLPHQMKNPSPNLVQICALYPPLGTHFWNMKFQKSISHSSSQIFEVIWFVIIIHAPITDICLKSRCFLLYLLIWTTRWLCLFYPPNRVDQQLQVAPAIQGKRSGTSNMSHLSPLTFKQRHLHSRSPWKAPNAQW